MTDVLSRICADKKNHVAAAIAARPLAVVEAAAREASAPRGFQKALTAAHSRGQYGLICEIKKASPSQGLIRSEFDPATLARAYEKGGAACLSVLTDEPYFQGRDDYLVAARSAVSLPALRKDFMIDPYQIPESRALGADCILIIMAALSDAQAAELEAAAFAWGMDALIEVHNAAELERGLKLKSQLIGINNRNLKTLHIDLQVTVELAPLVPAGRLVVGESGIHSREDLDLLNKSGVNSFLIGSSLMGQPDVAAATAQLLKGSRAA
jgi:indole-3-glycerol phosphate synthase